MSGKPNNFPREGQHNPVTREAVEHLQAQRPTLNAGMHYTIGGSVETVVHSNLNAEREAAITTGARALQRASNDLRKGFDTDRDARRAEYICAQKMVVTFHPTRNRATPGR